ncbi:MAG: hypothetical protein FWD34_02545 [Oscillospiraceae bacterium]|nr:hypothetical protein [Oscillospiraceae bacterium]
MKYVLLSSDSVPSVFSVPDVVADNLQEYCLEFCNKWLPNSPDAGEYRIDGCLCYNENDFIKYLNKWIFPDEPSEFVELLEFSVIYEAVNGWKSSPVFTEKYGQCAWFNF